MRSISLVQPIKSLSRQTPVSTADQFFLHNFKADRPFNPMNLEELEAAEDLLSSSYILSLGTHDTL